MEKCDLRSVREVFSVDAFILLFRERVVKGSEDGRDSYVPIFRAIPPRESPPAAHCRIRALAARRSWFRLARAVLVSSLMRVAWKKQRARSVVSDSTSSFPTIYRFVEPQRDAGGSTSELQVMTDY